jgi:uncharacterized protein YggU (UPF0235/DUF167 family)
MTRIRFLVKPGSKQNQIGKNPDGTYWLRVAAAPAEGRANSELIQFLSELIKLPKSRIRLISGFTSRFKILEIDLEATDLSQKLDHQVVS